MVQKSRLDYLDHLRGTAILLIMLHHSLQYFAVFSPVVEFVASFHVTVFFVVSGVLASMKYEDQNAVKDFLCKRAKSLLVPYVCFSLINSFIKLGVLAIRGEISEEVLLDEMVQMCITGNGTVWFLLALFGVECVFYGIRNYIGQNHLVFGVTGILAAILPFYITCEGHPVLQVVMRILMGYVFYLEGFYAYRFWLKREKRAATVYGTVFLIFGCAVYFFFGSQINYYGNTYVGIWNSLVVNSGISVGMLLLFYAILSGRRVRILDYYGKNSLIVMVIHPILLMCYIYPLGVGVYNYSTVRQVITGMVLFLALTMLEIPFVEIINRYFLFLFGKSYQKKRAQSAMKGKNNSHK